MLSWNRCEHLATCGIVDIDRVAGIDSVDRDPRGVSSAERVTDFLAYNVGCTSRNFEIGPLLGQPWSVWPRGINKRVKIGISPLKIISQLQNVPHTFWYPEWTMTVLSTLSWITGRKIGIHFICRNWQTSSTPVTPVSFNRLKWLQTENKNYCLEEWYFVSYWTVTKAFYLEVCT